MDSSGGQPWALVAEVSEVDVSRRAELARTLEGLIGLHPRWLLLATCHRVELYGFGPCPSPGMRRIEGEAAVRHLFRVASGLRSAVAGESEILGQVRQALARARASGTDARLTRLFESAIAAGRTARAELPAPGAGLAERAVRWLSDRAALSGRPVLVVGTGVMGGALAAAASSAGAVVTRAGRRPGRAALDLVGAARHAPAASAVAVALRGGWPELESEIARRAPPRLPPLADLSAPPAVTAPVRAALGPDFLGIDQLWEAPPASSAWVGRAEEVVDAAVREYMGWLAGRGSVGTLVALRERSEERRRARVERLFRRLPGLAARERELVETMTRQLVTDLLHEPVSALRADPDGGCGEAARRLFGL